MLIIEGGRSCLYQWDVDQRLEVVNSDVLEVHFSNAVIGAALVCEVYEEDGRRFANIPNVLLQQAWAIQAHGCCELRVRDVQVIRVVRREKPADYVYTETEVKSYEDLDKRITALEENGGGGGGAVQSVNGKTGEVELTAEDVGALPSTGGKVGGSVNATGTLIAGQGNTYAARLAGASGMAMMSAVDKSGKMVNNIQLSPSRTTLGQPLAVNSGGHGGKTPAEGRKNLEVDSSTEVSDKIAAQVGQITPATIGAIADRDGIIQERHLGAQVVKNSSIAYGAISDSRIAEKTITFQRLSDACVEDIKAAALPTASADIKGGVKVGDGLQMDGDVLSAVPIGKFELIKSITFAETGVARLEEYLDDHRGLWVEFIMTAPTNIKVACYIYTNIGNQVINYRTHEFPANSERVAEMGVIDVYGKWLPLVRAISSVGAVGGLQTDWRRRNEKIDGYLVGQTRINHIKVTTDAENGFPTNAMINIYGVKDNA